MRKFIIKKNKISAVSTKIEILLAILFLISAVLMLIYGIIAKAYPNLSKGANGMQLGINATNALIVIPIIAIILTIIWIIKNIINVNQQSQSNSPTRQLDIRQGSNSHTQPPSTSRPRPSTQLDIRQGSGSHTQPPETSKPPQKAFISTIWLGNACMKKANVCKEEADDMTSSIKAVDIDDEKFISNYPALWLSLTANRLTNPGADVTLIYDKDFIDDNDIKFIEEMQKRIGFKLLDISSVEFKGKFPITYGLLECIKTSLSSKLKDKSFRIKNFTVIAEITACSMLHEQQLIELDHRHGILKPKEALLDDFMFVNDADILFLQDITVFLCEDFLENESMDWSQFFITHKDTNGTLIPMDILGIGNLHKFPKLFSRSFESNITEAKNTIRKTPNIGSLHEINRTLIIIQDPIHSNIKLIELGKQVILSMYDFQEFYPPSEPEKAQGITYYECNDSIRKIEGSHRSQPMQELGQKVYNKMMTELQNTDKKLWTDVAGVMDGNKIVEEILEQYQALKPLVSTVKEHDF
ncbi:MAG: hypothetical protein OEY79_03805 [Anaplasmataceae bacterium]|nr:hypothetical protein [Anaplasmataceae bacterium]